MKRSCVPVLQMPASFSRRIRRFLFTEHFKKLRKVTFHSLLGTSEDKVMRFRKLAAWIADRIRPDLKTDVDRAAFLAKADLETQMVYEFPSLQGIMGRECADATEKRMLPKQFMNIICLSPPGGLCRKLTSAPS